MKIIYIPTLNSGVVYWRIENYAQTLLNLRDTRVYVKYFDPKLEKAWDKLCVGYGQTSWDIQQWLEPAFMHFDVIIFQKIQSKEALFLIEEYKKKYPRVIVIAEIDDSIGDITPSNLFIERFKDQHQWAAYHCHISDGVICSTPYLADSISAFKDKEFIHVAPNCIHKDSWVIKENTETRAGNPRVGYVAGGGHDEDLEIIYEAMVPLLAENPTMRFIIRYGGYRPEWLKKSPQIDFKTVSWKIWEYPQKLYNLKLDVALAPLRDVDFNRCKSNLRWLEFASMGVPIVASNVEPFKNTNGLITLAENTAEDFRDKIMAVCNDKDKSHTKEILTAQCFDNYNLENEAEKILDFLEGLKV